MGFFSDLKRGDRQHAEYVKSQKRLSTSLAFQKKVTILVNGNKAYSPFLDFVENLKSDFENVEYAVRTQDSCGLIKDVMSIFRNGYCKVYEKVQISFKDNRLTILIGNGYDRLNLHWTCDTSIQLDEEKNDYYIEVYFQCIFTRIYSGEYRKFYEGLMREISDYNNNFKLYD